MNGVLNILSAGAAQSVVSGTAAALRSEGACAIVAAFGAVHAMKARIVAGEPADVIILTRGLIDELAALGVVAPASRIDLGSVATGVAVRAGTPPPDVGTLERLKRALLDAPRIVCPDPRAATAGKALVDALSRLGIFDVVGPRLDICPSGGAAAAKLAAAGEPGAIGIMQVTEILAAQGLALAGPLPGELSCDTVYSAGLAAASAQPDRAREFIARLTAAPSMLETAGFAPIAD